jgi:PKD repeat protein
MMPLLRRRLRLYGPVLACALLALALPGCKNDDERTAAPTAAAAPAAPSTGGGGLVRALCSSDPVEGFAPLTVTFNPDVAPQGDAGLTYLWDFGDGTTSTATRPQHLYTDSGTRTVRLTASRAGTTATCTTDVYVYGDLSASCRSQPIGGTDVHFRVVPSFCVADDCRYEWDFGGPGSGTGVNGPRPDFSYSAGGTYTATATVFTARRTATCRTTVTVP